MDTTNQTYRWVPPGLDENQTEEFLSLKTGIPVSARDAICGWLTDGRYSHESYKLEFLIRFQAAAGIDLKLKQMSAIRVDVAKEFFKKLDKTTFTYLVDFKLSSYSTGTNYCPNQVRSLETILHSAGSKWTVGMRQGRYGLVERIPEGVALVVDQVLSPQDKASGLLRRAWENAYGISPSPSAAYQDAVKAVEVLANPLLSPRDKDATLGKDINVLRTQIHKWRFVMQGSKSHSATEHVLHMMQLLWHSQSDRHGQSDYEDVSHEEAKAAILLATTLVGWLAQGSLQRIDGT